MLGPVRVDDVAGRDVDAGEVRIMGKFDGISLGNRGKGRDEAEQDGDERRLPGGWKRGSSTRVWPGHEMGLSEKNEPTGWFGSLAGLCLSLKAMVRRCRRAKEWWLA